MLIYFAKKIYKYILKYYITYIFFTGAGNYEALYCQNTCNL
jgi:hypothetical protein